MEAIRQSSRRAEVVDTKRKATEGRRVDCGCEPTWESRPTRSLPDTQANTSSSIFFHKDDIHSTNITRAQMHYFARHCCRRCRYSCYKEGFGGSWGEGVASYIWLLQSRTCSFGSLFISSSLLQKNSYKSTIKKIKNQRAIASSSKEKTKLWKKALESFITKMDFLSTETPFTCHKCKNIKLRLSG